MDTFVAIEWRGGLRMGTVVDDGGGERAATAAREFAAVVNRWRRLRGLSQQQFAELINFHSSYVSHIESQRHRPTEPFARNAEEVLTTGGAIMASWQNYRDAVHGDAGNSRLATRSTGLVGSVTIAVEDSWHRLDSQYYATRTRRTVVNGTDAPLLRMALVIPPGQLIETAFERMQRPSMWREMNLCAVGDGRDLDFEPERYRDGLLEGWLLFRDSRGTFPVPPGGTITLEYSYRIPSDLCSPRFEQMVTMPTGPMTLCLEFPLLTAPSRVWGTEVSTSGEWIWPSPPTRAQTATGVEFRCSVATPVTGRTYRWEWPAVVDEGREAVSPAA